jgi:hypothetical protein
MQLILSDDGLDGWDLGDLMPLRLGVLSMQWVLAAPAPLGLDRDDHIHLEVDDQLERGGLLDGEVSGLPTIDEFVYISGGALPEVVGAWSISHEAPHLRKLL